MGIAVITIEEKSISLMVKLAISYTILKTRGIKMKYFTINVFVNTIFVKLAMRLRIGVYKMFSSFRNKMI